jgi:3-oxosteroid 1-dehydrogenase
VSDRADVVVVGSGVGGLVTALRARAAGLDVLVLEKAPCIGGTSSWSGGVLWVPDNPVMREAGAEDSPAAALTYLRDVVGDAGPATSTARKEAFLRAGPAMVTFLRGQGLEFVYCDGYPDYYPHRPGGHERGRALNAEPVDLRVLGPWRRLLRPQDQVGLKVDLLLRTLAEAPGMALATRSADGARTAARVAGRTLAARLTRTPTVAMGQALTARLLAAAVAAGVRFRLSRPVTDLITTDAGVTGLATTRGEVTAARAVVLAGGGFAHNGPMRKAYGPDPASTDWTAVPREDTGEVILAAQRAGAALDLMDEAIWSPTSVLPDGTPAASLWERAVPHSIMVDSGGARYCDEAASYMEVGQRMYERHREVPAVPSWLVFDRTHRRRYPFGAALPGVTPERWLTSGYLKRADTLAGLAAACGIDPAGLAATVERFNRMAATGVDMDFHRGENAYDREFGDPRHPGPNPNLGAIATPPFHAVAMYPGDVGTSGGIVTDEHARALRDDGTPIPRLYATGACTASVMGRMYPGAGASLGPAAVFGYLAAEHAAAHTTEEVAP